MGFNNYTKAFVEYLDGIPEPSIQNPIPALFSACLAGVTCGFDGTAYGTYPQILDLFQFKNLKPVKFCPENASFGTPRDLCNIHGGDGYDVLLGKAKVLTENGEDWTEGMIAGAIQMLEFAKNNNVKIAIMMDTSAACGSQVIYNGHRLIENKSYQIGTGVAAALLRQNDIHVISQRDLKSLQYLIKKLDSNYHINTDAIDHNESEWFQDYFKK